MLFRYDTWVKTAQGPALAGVYVYVCNQPANTTVAPPSPLAAIYSDPNGQFPITQPLQTDGFGHADFYIASGTYTVMVAIGNVVVNVYPDQSIGTLGGINGIIITGTPVAGQALVATSPTTATWETIVGSTLNFPAIPNEFLTSYNSVTGMFAAAQPLLSGIGNPIANVDFVFESTTFTRSYSGSYPWNESLVNTMLATGSQNNNSPAIALFGSVWNGSASVPDRWDFYGLVGTGPNPQSTLLIEHAGSSGLSSVQVPNLVCLGVEYLNGQLYDSTGAPGTAGQVLSTLGGAGTRWVTSSATAPTFKTNGVANTTQSTLNLVNGTNVTIDSDGSGDVTISAQGASFSTAGQGVFLGPGITMPLYGTNWEDTGAPLDDAANVVDVFQFTLSAAWTIRSCTFVWSNNLPGTASFGIYAINGNLLIDSGTFDLEGATNTPVQNSFSAVVLPPGVYWFAQTASGAGINCPAFNWVGTSTPGAGALAMINTPQVTSGTAANPRTAGVMPATLGVVMAQTSQSLFPAAPVWST